MDTILKLAGEQGIWALLFCFLLFYVLKQQEKRDLKSEQREIKYQEIISEITQDLSCKVDKVAEKVEQILNK